MTKVVDLAKVIIHVDLSSPLLSLPSVVLSPLPFSSPADATSPHLTTTKPQLSRPHPPASFYIFACSPPAA